MSCLRPLSGAISTPFPVALLLRMSIAPAAPRRACPAPGADASSGRLPAGADNAGTSFRGWCSASLPDEPSSTAAAPAASDTALPRRMPPSDDRWRGPFYKIAGVGREDADGVFFTQTLARRGFRSVSTPTKLPQPASFLHKRALPIVILPSQFSPSSVPPRRLKISILFGAISD